MLRHLANARFAPKHSPLAEQRLVFWAKATGEASGANAERNPDDRLGLIELSRAAPERAVRKIGRDTRTHLQFLNDAANVDLNKLTEDEAAALAVKHADVLQGEEPELVRGTTREAVTRVLTAKAGGDGASVLEMSRETGDTLADMERIDWSKDASIADYYDRRKAMVRRLLSLPPDDGGSVPNKTELVLRMRYLPEVDTVMRERRAKNEKVMSERREAQLDNAAVNAMVGELATVNWQNQVEVAAALTRFEGTLATLLPDADPNTFVNRPRERLDWMLNQLPELRARIEKIRAEQQHAEYLRLSASEVDVGELTEALSQADITDDAEMERIYAEHRTTIERVFLNNDTPIPIGYSGKDAVVWVMANVPGMAAAVEAEREKVLKDREFDVPGAQYLPQDEFRGKYLESLRADASRPDEVQDSMADNMPSAFQFKNVIYFNLDHPEAKDPVKGPRSVIHELSHVAVRNETRKDKDFVAKAKADLVTAGKWEELSELVRDAFGARGSTMPDDEILDEAIAIYLGGEKHPYARESDDRTEVASWKIHQLLSGIRMPTDGTPSALAGTLGLLGAEVDRHAPAVTERLRGAAEDNEAGNKLAADYQETLRTNTGEQKEVKDKIGDTVAAEEEKTKSLSDIGASIRSSESTFKSFKENVPRLREAIGRMGSDRQRAELQSLSAIEQFMGETAADLATARVYHDALDRWDLDEKKGGLTAKEKADLMEKWNFGPDEKTNREQAQKALSRFVSGIAVSVKQVEEFMRTDRPDPPPAEDKSFWKMLRENVFGNGKQVEWVSWSDLVKIVGVFKEAIVTRWSEGKDRKAHRIADNLARGSFIAQPIEHTLKKQARAANEKQTHDFLEFLKTAGLNYDTLMAPGTGLYWKLSNVNEKKAVLEFAAGKAWLFDLDKLNGSNVYGMDYNAEFGPEQFEELVQSHEGGKAKMVKEGIEKVDKEPDVPPIMNVLVHELRHKNIFVVQGIMQRLQDKAKYSHSHTWMLTTILMLIRDESKSDPTLLKCLDKGMIDNISNHTIQQSAWTITWLKMKRNQIDDWKKGKAEFGNNIVTKTMEDIETRLKQAGAEFPDTPEGRLGKYEAIGMVLAGKTASEENGEFKSRILMRFGKHWKKGTKISLFETAFTEYRKEFFDATAQGTCSPAKTDNDYFNNENGGSDIMLLNPTHIKKILIKDSTGQWTTAEKAEGFFAQLFDRDDELAKLDPIALRNFKQEMSTKINIWWNDLDGSRREKFPQNRDQSGRRIIKELVDRNLVTDVAWNEMDAIIKNNYQVKK